MAGRVMMPALRKRAIIWTFVLLAIAVAGLAWWILSTKEPTYGGKSLSLWVNQYASDRWRAPSRDSANEAQAAIQHIGTNSIPFLLKMLNPKESTLRVKLTPLIPKSWLARFHIDDLTAYRKRLDARRELGANGLAALGPAAKPALPALLALLNDKNERTRYLAFFTLRCLGPDARETIPQLIAHLDDHEFAVRDECVMALGTIHQEPETVVPILIHFAEKNRGDTILSQDAVGSLAEFGERAKPAVPMLVEMLKSSDAYLRTAATNALKRIDPETADKVGVK